MAWIIGLDMPEIPVLVEGPIFGSATKEQRMSFLGGLAHHKAEGGTCLFFQGDGSLGGLDGGITFGDGRRCAGQSGVRLQVVVSNANGTASSSIPLAATGGVLAGQTKYYQFWYRDPLGSPCGSNFNLSNGLAIEWAP